MENQLFTGTSVPKAYLKLSMPLVFSMVVTLIYNLADTYFVAQTGNTDLVAGVSLGAPVFTLLMAVGNIFAQGGSSLISRYLGAQQTDSVRRVSCFCFYVTLAVGVVIGAGMLLIQQPVLALLGADADTWAHASAYYFWLAAGAPVLILSFIHANLLRAEGMSRQSMTGTILGAVVNIVLDPVFISVLGLGAAGAAIATILGYLCCDVFFLAVVLTKSKALSVRPAHCRASGNQVVQILAVGIPSAVVNLMQSASMVLTNQFLLPYGNDKIAAMGIVLKVSMIVLLLLTGFAFGGQPLFGYYYGAGDKERFARLLRFCVQFLSAVALVLSAAVFAAAPGLMRLFLDNDGVVRDGALMLRCQVVTMVFVGFVLLMTIVFQSMGKAGASFLLSISRQGVAFVAVLLVGRQLAGYNGILLAQAVADTLTMLGALVLFRTQLQKQGYA
ncbi:MATE family efflux transporter [Subdoligranulum variabile]|uniref:MATE family efflux transporter n=1 Tax=Subdoligranulum variabile TaxID=214851 RepID=UPI0029435435|nr:MATE family efflux transporter [Subdoligranulum variabile]